MPKHPKPIESDGLRGAAAEAWRDNARIRRVLGVDRPQPIDRRTPPYARQAKPGDPIEILWGNEPPLPISDSNALYLAQQLTLFVLGNMQAKARANAERT